MWSVREAFLVVFIAVVAIPLGLFWLWPRTSGLGDERSRIEQQHLVIARLAAADLERRHARLVDVFDEASRHLADSTKPAPSSSALADVGLEAVRLVELATGAVTRARAFVPGYHAEPSGPQELFRLVADTAKGPDAIAHADAAEGKHRFIRIARRQGRHLAIGTVSHRFIGDFIRKVGFAHTGHAFVSDRSGRVVAHPAKAQERRRQSSTGSSVLANHPQGSSGAVVLDNGSGGANSSLVAGYAQVPGTPWTVVVAQSRAELRLPWEAYQNSLFMLFSMGLIAAALVALRVSIFFVGPIGRLLTATRTLEAGKRPATAAMHNRFVPRELTELAETFDAMAASTIEARAAEAAARQRAERANERKTEVMHYVTHELRSPVNAILGFSQLLVQARQGPLGSPTYEAHARDLHGGAKHLLALINDLLDLSRIEAGRYELCEAPVDIDEIVERARRYVLPTAEARSIRVDVRYESGFPTVLADERALFQTMLNLLSNSVRYGNDFGEVVAVSRVRPDGQLEIAVIDNGPGIPAEALDRVLEPFQRVTGPHCREVQGSGLGLPIVKRLIELHGGVFQLESDVGIGTTARVLLPAVRVQRNEATGVAAPASERNAPAGPEKLAMVA